MCKRIISFLLSVFLFCLVWVPVSATDFSGSVSAQAAVLMVADTGEVLYSRNADVHLPMASTTKIMTSLIAIENDNFEKEITVTDEMVRVEGTSIGLLPGDKITIGELVYGMLLESGNDAANVTAYAVAGGKSEFADLMNSKARQIGMTNTHFVTPSGLDDAEHYSTAYDMALLGCRAIKNDVFCSICSAYSVCVDYGNPPYKRYLTNHNRLLKSYEGTIGIKTGFTKKSGRCLVSAAVRNGVTLVCVTLNAPDDWNDHKKLFDFGFDSLTAVNIDNDNNEYLINCVGTDKKSIKARLSYSPVIYSASGSVECTKEVFLDKFVYAPVKCGDVVGCVRYYQKNGSLLLEVPVVADENIESNTVENSVDIKKTIFDRIKNIFSG